MNEDNIKCTNVYHKFIQTSVSCFHVNERGEGQRTYQQGKKWSHGITNKKLENNAVVNQCTRTRISEVAINQERKT